MDTIIEMENSFVLKGTEKELSDFVSAHEIEDYVECSEMFNQTTTEYVMTKSKRVVEALR